MNVLFAAGLFDSPWVVLAILIGSALANWLSKRRQEKQAGQRPEGDEPPPPSSPPPGEVNLEETLRRLMGEEPPPPVPPVIPQAARGELPPAQTWSEKKPLPPQSGRQPAKHSSRVLLPPVALAPVSFMPQKAGETEEQTARRFEQLNEQARHPATVVIHKHQPASRFRPRSAARWRDTRSVRQAFIASLVFAPPKSLEP